MPWGSAFAVLHNQADLRGGLTCCQHVSRNSLDCIVEDSATAAAEWACRQLCPKWRSLASCMMP